MGNPDILGNNATWPGGSPVEPPRLRVLWTVYRLRDQGVKLPPEVAMRTGKTGRLELLRSSLDASRLRAKLWEPSSDVAIDSLDNAQLVRGPRDGGLLLHGTVLSVARGNVSEIPQAWWCLVHSAEPQTEKGPASREDCGA